MSQFGGSLWGSSGSGPIPPPGTLQAQSYIYLALRRCGHLRPGYQPSPELLNDLLLEWQLLFDELNVERNMHYAVPTYYYPITGPGSQTGGNGYEIGPTAADWVGPRPESIIHANLVMLNTPAQPVYVPLRSITAEEWAGLSVLQIPPITVTSLFYYSADWPSGIFNVFPPLSAGNAIQLYCFGILDAPTSLTDAYGGPPGYAEMVVACMAAKAFPLISKSLAVVKTSQARLDRHAYEMKQKLRSINRQLTRMGTDFPSGRANSCAFYDSFVTWTGNPQ